MSDANFPTELGSTDKNKGVQLTPNGVEKLFGQSFEIKRLENGKPIPVGGSSLFTDELDKTVIGDFDHFSLLFQEMHNAVAPHDTPQLKQWLETQKLLVDSKLVAVLWAFTRKLEEKYPAASENAPARNNMYSKATGKKEVKLSAIFENHVAECAEIAALAQYFLQTEEVNSSFFSGEVLWSKDHEFGEKHSFIVVREKDKQYIFDPANPTRGQEGLYPSLYTLKTDFDAEVRKGKKRYITGTNILTNREVYYGVGNGTNVNPANISP